MTRLVKSLKQGAKERKKRKEERNNSWFCRLYMLIL